MEIGASFLNRNDKERYPEEEEGDDGAYLEEGIDRGVVGRSWSMRDDLTRWRRSSM